MTKPIWRSVIGPSDRRRVGGVTAPTAAIWSSHQMFHAWSDRIGKISFW